ncbi:MAG: VWA domain-containing protein, partial [Deltaproteobacteria bacterium]|nr:VWA domain-containing protein [Deltaproteobacteria bacterium]
MDRRTLALTTALAAGTVMAAAPEASAQSCDPSRMMVILDQSSSMVRNSIAGDTLWDIAVTAMDNLTTSFQDKLQMGLMKFPEPDQCNPGAVFVSPAVNSKSSIMSQLSAPPPDSGNYTPMYQTLQVAQSVPELQLSDVPNYVVLVTDGWQWCDIENNSADRFKPIDEVADLAQMGVKTYVVGFGASADVLTLNGMAVEGGTAIPGCDPTNTSASASDNCYY